MSLADQLGVMVLTYNEADNIGRTLSKLVWAKRILVVDSGSTDGTLDIVRQYPLAEVVQRHFDDFASQCNFGLSRIATDWVLSLDADYELSDKLVTELRELAPAADIGGCLARFVYKVAGRPLRGALYPPRVVLYRRSGAIYENEGHGHRVKVEGRVLPLSEPIYHDDRKPLSRWFASQREYARLEADYLLASRPSALRWSDRIRLMAWPAPILVFLYTLLVKRCLLDGWAGWLYTLQRTLAELLIAIEIVDRRLTR